jgi:hypothetical protein
MFSKLHMKWLHKHMKVPHVPYIGRYFCPILSKTGNFRKIWVALSSIKWHEHPFRSFFLVQDGRTGMTKVKERFFCRFSLGTRKKCINKMALVWCTDASRCAPLSRALPANPSSPPRGDPWATHSVVRGGEGTDVADWAGWKARVRRLQTGLYG